MASSHFASRHRKDLSTDMIRTKIARRKSLSQKENRHKEYERNRHIGLKDSNIPILQGRILAPLEETSQELAPEKASAKPRSTKTVLNDQRKKMLHKYKEEKQLQKLKEQREKAKRGVFKVGLYRPDMPGFLLSHSKPTTVKPDPNQAISSVRITRSRAKEQMDQTKVNNGRTIQTIQPSQRPTSEKKVPDKEKKAVKLVAPTAVRITRSATQATNQIPKTASSTTTRRPVSRATNGNELERKLPIKGRPVKNTEPNPDKDTTFKVENNKTALDLQTSAVNEMDPEGTSSNEEILPKTNATKMKGKNSFAPKDFVFQPLDGVKIYQAASMIPRRANSLLTPYSWSPLKAEVDESEEATKDPLAPKCKAPSSETVRQGSTPGHWPLGSLAVNKEDDLAKNEDATISSTGPPGKEAPSPKMTGGLMSPPQHDVPYFRNILQSETEKLTSSCLVWDQKLELDIPDDAKDLIRTTVGQTRLLMKERFKQFEGLVNDCEYKRGEKETTCTDLDGFWDMVSFQIDDVNQKFNNLSKLEESNWQHNSNTSKKTVRKKGVSNTTNKPKQDGGGRIAARNRLAAIKNAMRQRMKQEEQAEAADSVVPTTVDTIVFDAGFFRIESPVKSFSGLSISAAHRSQRLRTPKSVGKAVSQSRAKMNLLRPTTTLGNSDSQCTKEEHVKTLPSDLPDNRSSSVGEDAQCPTVQDILDVNHDANKINFEMDCLPCDRMNISLLAVEVTNNTENIEGISEVVEGMELNSSIVEEDVLMSSSDKQLPSPSNISQQDETKVSLGQSVLIDGKSITVECHLLDSA